MKVLLICNYKGAVGGISGQVAILQRKLRQEGHHADIFSTKSNVLQRLALFAQLRQKAKRYDILHIHCCSGWGFLPAVMGVAVGRRLKKRIVLTYHGGGGAEFFARHTRLVRRTLTKTDVNIVLSGFLAKVFDRYSIPYVIIPNILEFDNHQYRERTALQPRFICVRSHEDLYNIPCILRAFQAVQQQIPDATLTLVGDGTKHEELIKMAVEMQLRNVEFTGRVDNAKIYDYLDRADIMLSAPRKDNMPVSLLEAMNAGLLVISSCVGGVPYMVQHGETGLLFESNNDNELSQLMQWSTQHPTETLSIIDNAREYIKSFDWGNNKTKIHQAYGLPT